MRTRVAAAIVAILVLAACDTETTTSDRATPGDGATTAAAPSPDASVADEPIVDRSDQMTDEPSPPDPTTDSTSTSVPTTPDHTTADHGLVVEPDRVRPGDRVALTVADDRARGLAWVLQAQDGDGWVDAFWLVSDANGDRPRSAPVSDESFEWELVLLLDAPWPDHVVVPDLATPGTYRLCPVDDDATCAELVVRRPGDQPDGPRPTAPVVPPPRD